MDVLGEDLGLEHGGKEMEAEEIEVGESTEDEPDLSGWMHATGDELYPALTPTTTEHPVPTPEGGEAAGGASRGMDVRGSGAEAQEREEIESEGEESEGNVSDDSGPRSLSLSSESEDSQKGAPLVRASGVPRGTPQEEGARGDSESSSWKSGPASTPECSRGGGVPGIGIRRRTASGRT
ncbi:Hypothetical predicted protein [Podarcis lilfordi]|uniref:Uncharacterized protein n=1 Tax=Podarcis lilfordi TaxID=74358 RepID=A0AA35JR32_9SAUR|nr:Hypothetical predicted protein [Podarcis lilfordi]